MTLITVTPPAGEPLTLAETKAHLRLDGTAEDDTLKALAAVARDHLERTTGLCLITRKLRLAVESICEDGVIQMLNGPVQSIDRITLYDGAGNPSDFPSASIRFDRDGPPTRLVFRELPDPASSENGIEVDFTAGFGATGREVPDSIRRALLLHVATLYEFRGAVPLDQQPAAIPEGYERLLAPFLVPRL